jgi:hypothetical protein
MKVCICEVEKHPQLVWMAFVEKDEECLEEEKAIKEHTGSEASCMAMNVPRRIVFMPKKADDYNGDGVEAIAPQGLGRRGASSPSVH